ncbi:MAG: hypothetical protein ABI442_03105 [Gemmatimonadaceae bacterium]
MKKPVSKKRAGARRAKIAPDEIRPEYDFSDAQPNPYAARFRSAVTVVVLDDDVAETFPDPASVNDALRALAKIANRPTKRRSSRRRTA